MSKIAYLLIKLIMLHLFLVILGEFKPLLMIFFEESQGKVQMFISWVKLVLLMIGQHLFVHI